MNANEHRIAPDVSGQVPSQERRIEPKLGESVPEIDRLKGLAILFVICIHAKLADRSFVYLQFIDRGVSVFLLLFGITAELWWMKHGLEGAGLARRWFRDRLYRLLPGYWAMLAIYWAAILSRQWPEEHYNASAPEVLLSVVGITPEARTTWFVTVVLFYVLVFPALRGMVGRLGALPSLAFAALATWLSGWFILDIIAYGERFFPRWNSDLNWYCHWIFPPRVAWHVVAGICIARFWRGRVGVLSTIVALLLTVAGIALSSWTRGAPQDIFGAIRRLSIAQLVDVPVAVTLLGALRWLPLPRPFGAVLSWCGRRSWGIYLGHLPVHEVLLVAGFDPERFGSTWRTGYACLLLLSGVLIAAVARRVWAGLVYRFSSAR